MTTVGIKDPQGSKFTKWLRDIRQGDLRSDQYMRVMVSRWTQALERIQELESDNKLLREALKRNHEWFLKYGDSDSGGYPDTEFCEMNIKALQDTQSKEE